jgi:predicted ATPase
MTVKHPTASAVRADNDRSGDGADATWRVRLLGGFEIDDGRHRLTRLRSRAAMALLARVAMAPARDHAREELAALLWPGADDATGRSRLRQTLSLLRAVLEPAGAPAVLYADRRVLRAVPGALWCDAAAFDEALQSRPDDALALYRGELLPGFFDEWLVDERQRLHALAERLRERVRAGLAHAATAPSVPTPPASSTAPSSPGKHTQSATRLPHYATRLIGADVQGARLLAQATEHRIVTVLGPGGCGKTRLAVEVAALACQAPSGAAAARFDSAVFTPLVAAVTRSELIDRLLMALRIEGAGPPLPQLQTALDGRRVVVVMDNAEQLSDDAVLALGDLVEHLPTVHWLVTSRRPLGLNGERSFWLEALTLPAPDAPQDEVALNPAVALFVDRARAHRPDFHVSVGNHAALALLVQWLDGLPLAIELAASHVRNLGPAALLALLQAARNDTAVPAASLAFLARRGTRSGSDPRQASMLAVIAWSWRLLTPAQQRLVSALSLLPAGGTLQVACDLADVFADPIGAAAPQGLAAAQSQLDELVACSVLRVAEGRDGQRRYLPLEPVREFALAQHAAPALRAARGQVLAWLLRWAQALPPTPPLPTVREELPNLLQALAAAPGDGEGNAALKLVLWLQSSWGEIALPGSALRVLDALLEAPGLDDSLAAGSHAMAATCWHELGHKEQVQRHMALALARPCTDPALRAMVLSRVARMHWRTNRDAVKARLLIEEALPLARAAKRPNTEASLLTMEGVISAVIDRNPARHAALSAQALALWQQSGNRHLINAGRYNVAAALHGAGRNAEILDELQALADDGRELQDWDLLSGALDVRGAALRALRRWPEAGVCMGQSLRAAWDGLQTVATMYALWNVAQLLPRLGHAALAAQTMGACAAQWQERCGQFEPSDARDITRVRRSAGCLLGPPAAHAAWQRGAALPLSDVVRAVLAVL